MYWQIYIMTQRGWLYWRNIWSWLEVSLNIQYIMTLYYVFLMTSLCYFLYFFLFTQVAVIICSLLRYTCSVYNFMLKTEMIDFLQKEDFKLPVDLSPIFFCEKVGQSSLIHYTVFLLSHYEKMT